MTYQEKLQDPRWQKKRLLVLERDKFSCRLCFDKKTTLHVHHDKYNKEPWDADLSELRCLCKHCHGLIGWMGKFISIKTVDKFFLVSGHALMISVCVSENWDTVRMVLVKHEDATGEYVGLASFDKETVEYIGLIIKEIKEKY